MLKKIIVASSIVALFGCNADAPADNGGSINTSLSLPSVTLASPTFTITDENGRDLALSGMEIGDLAELGMMSADTSSDSLRSVSRISETDTFDCFYGGSYTASYSSNDFDDQTGEMAEQGTMTSSVSYANCDEDGSTMDGGFNMTMVWDGFNSATGDMSFMKLTMTFNSFSMTYGGDTTQIDGAMAMSMTDDAMSVLWNYSVVSPATNNQVITSRTLTPVTGGLYGYPTSGSWVVNGAGGTNATATIVANGIEVSVNGGQATLVTWTEMETM